MDKRSLIFVFALALSLFFVNQWFSSKDDARKKQIAPQESVATQPTSEVSKTPEPAFPTQYKADKEQFYVLQNDYQQLVFSNIGGALAEINLPLKSKEHPESVIREIDFDRTLEKDYPFNAHFPAHPYYIVDSSSSVKEMEEPVLGGYYPLLRRGLMGPHGEQSIAVASHYYALNIVSHDPETANLLYKVVRFEKGLIQFEATQGHRKITKIFSFAQDPSIAPYCLDMSIKIEGDARGLWLTSGVPEVELTSGSFSPVLKYRLTKQQKAQVEVIDLPKTTTSFSSIYPNWVCNSNGFLGLIINPLSEIGAGFSTYFISGESDPTRLSIIDAHYQLYPMDKYPGYEIHLPLRLSNETMTFRVFAGPFQNEILKKVDAAYSDPVTGYNPDYTASQSFQGWFAFISEPFAKFLFILMKFFYQITHSWGFSIILLTAALRIMLYPLNAWSIKSTARMQQVSPEVSAIQEKYKKDPKRAQVEIMNLYKEAGVNPLTGCFPILIQIPFLIGMFDLLKSTFDLRGASFIPGWIDNLTAPDVLFSWNYPLIFFGTQLHFLPVLLGVVMYVQQKFSSTAPKNKALMTDQQKQQKMMGNIMTIVFTVMFYHFPSGLNIYWLSSMLFGILQQWYMTRKMHAQPVVLKK